MEYTCFRSNSRHFMQSEITPTNLNKKEACARLNILVRTLKNMVHAKQFPLGVRMGKWAYWLSKNGIAVSSPFRRRGEQTAEI